MRIRDHDRQHASFCGIDLHASSLHVCILDAQGPAKRLGDADP
jgi:hypothetical protein